MLPSNLQGPRLLQLHGLPSSEYHMLALTSSCCGTLRLLSAVLCMVGRVCWWSTAGEALKPSLAIAGWQVGTALWSEAWWANLPEEHMDFLSSVLASLTTRSMRQHNTHALKFGDNFLLMFKQNQIDFSIISLSKRQGICFWSVVGKTWKKQALSAKVRTGIRGMK